jgi:hypothetical protein
MASQVVLVASLPVESGRTLTSAEIASLSEAALTTALDRVVSEYGGHWISPVRALYGGANGNVALSRTYEWPIDDAAAPGSSFVAHLLAEARRVLPGFAGWQISTRPVTPADTAAPTGRILIVFHTQESSVLQGSAPEAHNIQAGFERNTRYTNPERGHWVGVAPRIVRQGALSGNNRTHATWLYEFPDTPWVRANLSQLVSEIQAAVQSGLQIETARTNTIGVPQPAAWDRVTATEYNPILNGPYEFWSCSGGQGCAAVTRTTVEFPNVTSTEYVENPIGPDSNLTHPGGSTDLWNDIKSFFTSPKFGWSIVIIGGIAALVYIAPLAATWTAARRPTSTRQNPRRHSSVDGWYAR